MKNYGYAGIRKIKIPLTADELSVENIKKYLPRVISAHRRNASKIEYLMNFVDGTYQEVYTKKRKFETDPDHNNIILENHASAIVSFKEGFLLGDKREFAPKREEDVKCLLRFDRFLADTGFYSKDLAIKHNVYATGIATSFIQPRTDIFKTVGEGLADYKTEEEGYSPDNDSPFIYECVDSRYNAVVYTSMIGQKNDSLFCFNISKQEDKTVITVYTRKFTATFDGSYSVIRKSVDTPSMYKELPMTEHRLGTSGIGIVETILDPLNAINTLISNGVDNVVDIVNQILIFTGCDIDQKVLTEGLKEGALSLPSTGPVSPDVKRIAIDLKFSETDILLREIMTSAYAIVGVPISINGGSAGSNNGAAYVGGGWTNALTVIKRDVLSFEESDRDILRKMLLICEKTPKCGVGKVRANDVDIKYNVSITDNILSNSQAIQNLVDAGMPFEHILKAVPICADIKTVAMQWKENIEKAKAEAERQNEQNGNRIGFDT